MKSSVGIIAEYNPFHNGHLYHLRESRRLTGAEIVIAAMSGYFVQRGAPAAADKWERAEAAVRCGADLVVEIPTVFACASAQIFASAAVEILEALGTGHICFGSESGNIEELKRIAREIRANSSKIDGVIAEKTKAGISYPRARKEAVTRFLGSDAAAVLDSPNNILAVEYISGLRNALPVTVRRRGPGYDDDTPRGDMASASAIRKMADEGMDISPLLPGESLKIFAGADRPSYEKYFDLIRYAALTKSVSEIENTPSGEEGLANRLKGAVRSSSNLEELAGAIKSKRYTRTRIDRLLAQLVLGIDRTCSTGNYIRVLGFSKDGASYLKELKKSEMCGLPVITNINRETYGLDDIQYGLSKDILAADIYNIISGRDMYRFSEYVRRPFNKQMTCK